jgi:sugar lactone lactonase YvrE
MNRGNVIVVVAIACAMLWPVSSAVSQPPSPAPVAGQQPPAETAQPSGRAGRGAGRGRDSVRRTLSPGPDLGYAYDMDPLPLPAGMEYARHVSSVAINSRGHIFVFHRAAAGKPQLLEFDQNQKFVRGFGEDIALRAHSMLIDKDDNIWITDQNGGTVRKLSPDGTLLWTIGEQGKEGDWDEAKGARLLWQPLAVALAPNGDIYIGMGHGGESASRGGGPARILHLDKHGKYINQWFGNERGPGHYTMVHALVLDPKGNVYISDREEYRVVVYDGKGNFIKTIQKPNLVCSMMATKDNEVFLATGADGQVEKIDWDGKVLGSTGVGPGKGHGRFGESCDMAMDAKGDIYVSDGVNGAITKLIAPKNQNK